MSFLLNLNRFHTCALFNENTLDFLEPQYSKGFFDSEPKYILKLFLSYTTNILLGLEKPELKTQVPSQTTHMYTCMHSHMHTHTHTHTHTHIHTHTPALGREKQSIHKNA